MISVIICSRLKTLHPDFLNNIRNTIGADFELIHIDNSENKYGICEAYNSGYHRSKFPYLCFLHDDVKFHSSDWGIKIIQHLENKATGIVGIAGADMVHRVPIAWTKVFSVSHNVVQPARNQKDISHHILLPKGYSDSKRTTITLDGILLGMRKEIMDQGIIFDENLPGFHGYDYDISIKSSLAGYQNYVIYDLTVEHFSGGKTNQEYYKNLIYIYKKFEKQLPVIGKTISNEQLSALPMLEKKNLNQLTKKMVRKGFSIKDIKTETARFARLIGDTKATLCPGVRIFLIRIFNAPQYIFSK